ncbi:MAG: baseplate protein [Candidatus Symbiopectobacterium sp. Dall1.0]|nr:baseplate protein [Candidatus Symbiopectobacterium sp. Dall1.0]
MKNDYATSVYWQPALNRPGERVSGLADIAQSMRIILGTPCGADLHRPDFGSNLYRYLDMPIEQAIPHVVRETVDALRRWEPRMQLLEVKPRAEAEHLWLRIRWQPITDSTPQMTEVAWR